MTLPAASDSNKETVSVLHKKQRAFCLSHVEYYKTKNWKRFDHDADMENWRQQILGSAESEDGGHEWRLVGQSMPGSPGHNHVIMNHVRAVHLLPFLAIVSHQACPVAPEQSQLRRCILKTKQSNDLAVKQRQLPSQVKMKTAASHHANSFIQIP